MGDQRQIVIFGGGFSIGIGRRDFQAVDPVFQRLHIAFMKCAIPLTVVSHAGGGGLRPQRQFQHRPHRQVRCAAADLNAINALSNTHRVITTDRVHGQRRFDRAVGIETKINGSCRALPCFIGNGQRQRVIAIRYAFQRISRH